MESNYRTYRGLRYFPGCQLEFVSPAERQISTDLLGRGYHILYDRLLNI